MGFGFTKYTINVRMPAIVMLLLCASFLFCPCFVICGKAGMSVFVCVHFLSFESLLCFCHVYTFQSWSLSIIHMLYHSSPILMSIDALYIIIISLDL